MAHDEKLSVIIARIDERLKALIDSNRKEHGIMFTKIKNLCDHVNEEHKVYNDRLVRVEKRLIAEENKYIGRMQLFKWLSIVLGTCLTILSILHILGRV